jgi:hypothetical protein
VYRKVVPKDFKHTLFTLFVPVITLGVKAIRPTVTTESILKAVERQVYLSQKADKTVS